MFKEVPGSGPLIPESPAPGSRKCLPNAPWADSATALYKKRNVKLRFCPASACQIKARGNCGLNMCQVRMKIVPPNVPPGDKSAEA